MVGVQLNPALGALPARVDGRGHLFRHLPTRRLTKQRIVPAEAGSAHVKSTSPFSSTAVTLRDVPAHTRVPKYACSCMEPRGWSGGLPQ